MPDTPKQTSLPTGFAGSYDDQISGSLDLNQILITHPAATYFMRVDANGHVGEGVTQGMIIIIDRALQPNNGDHVVAMVEGELLLRILVDTPSERALISEVDNSRIAIDTLPDLELWGVVTASIRQFHQPS